MKKALLAAVLVLVIVPLGVMAAWMMTETALKATSGPDTCGITKAAAPAMGR